MFLPQALQVLERTPAVLHALLRDLDPFWTEHNYGDRTWSAQQVVGHLIVCERDDWMPRLRRILAHGESVPFDPFPHDATINSPLPHLLDDFREHRARNLAELRSMTLSPADLARTGTHPALGRVTASQLLATWTAHDLHHLRQIALAMAWQYRDEVGPWRAYLNTFDRPANKP